MPEPVTDLVWNRRPTAERPLLGQTVLVVEDSRFACEAIRLLCLRSGARIRRADSLAAAARHLAVYRPSVVLIDLGLPDGSGLTLLGDLAHRHPRVPVLLAISGDDTQRDAAMDAGADDFLPKPLASLGAFQAAVLAHLPPAERPQGPRPAPDAAVRPDAIALRDDLAHVCALLRDGPDDQALAYAAQFLDSLARTSGDRTLADAAEALESGTGTPADIAADLGRTLDGRQTVVNVA